MSATDPSVMDLLRNRNEMIAHYQMVNADLVHALNSIAEYDCVESATRSNCGGCASCEARAALAKAGL